ncbi:MAG: polysaccharide biosynthesis protein [Gordonia sp. (in: high G+C Gram-positive bacteria)]|uniref:polysaccharide biosynthesis protein n=1 Tax=Gordonia sp. (in: high G+C Gram-positive bacteria) TaxID=84139 RepID=UPI0039E6C6C7
MTEPATAAQRTGVVRSLGVVTAGSLVANALAYLVQWPASRELGPEGYGEFSVLLAALLVIAVPALALQNVVARETVLGASRAALWRLITTVALIVTALSIVAAPFLAALAGTSVTSTFAATAAAGPLVVVSGAQGLLQGAGRFGLLGVVLAAVGVLRSAPVIVTVLTGGGAGAALAAGTAGTVVAAVGVGLLATPTRLEPRTLLEPFDFVPSQVERNPARGGVGVQTVLFASGVQLVIIVAVSLDLLLSRTVLDASAAGTYALGAVATKAAFWLPQAVGVVVYPRLADPITSRRALGAAARVLAVIGAVVTAAAAVAGPLVPAIVSEDYRPVAGLIWLFALTGALLSLLQLLLLAAVARDRARGAIPALGVLLIETALILTVAHSVLSLVLIAAGCAAAAVVLTALWGRSAAAGPSVEPGAAPTAG